MSRYDNIKDEELIARFRKGEEGISDYLIEKYKEQEAGYETVSVPVTK